MKQKRKKKRRQRVENSTTHENGTMERKGGAGRSLRGWLQTALFLFLPPRLPFARMHARTGPRDVVPATFLLTHLATWVGDTLSAHPSISL